jgi:hypothetical protein
MTETIKTYNSEQIVLSSGRIVLNSRSNDVFISSKQFINLSSGNKVTIDVGSKDSTNSDNQFLVNAPRIQFGLETKGRTVEPSIKGDKLEEVYNETMDITANYTKMMNAAVFFPPLAAIASTYLLLKQQSIKLELSEPGNVKSDTVYSV